MRIHPYVDDQGNKALHYEFTIDYKTVFDLVNLQPPENYGILTNIALFEASSKFAKEYNCIPYGYGADTACHFLASPEQFLVIQLKLGHITNLDLKGDNFD